MKFVKPEQIVWHILALIANLYYSTIVAAFVYDLDEWLPAILRGLPLFAVMSAGWLFFYRFRVLFYSYLAFIATSLFLLFCIFFPSFALGHHTFLLIPMGDPDGNSTFWFSSMLYQLVNFANKGVYLWSPYIIYLFFLYRGLIRKCPKCNLVDGLYARQISHHTPLGSSTYTVNETTEKRSRIWAGAYEGGTLVERVTTPVEYQHDSYEAHCYCRRCGHQWTFMKSFSTKKN